MIRYKLFTGMIGTSLLFGLIFLSLQSSRTITVLSVSFIFVLLNLMIIILQKGYSKDFFYENWKLNLDRSVAIFSLVILPAISLIYSANLQYGIIKFLSIILVLVPTILISIFYFKNFTQNKLYEICILGLAFLFLSLIPTLIDGLYNFRDINKGFTAGKWSHVIMGKFGFFFFFFYTIIILHIKRKNFTFVLILINALLLYGLLFTTHRMSILMSFFTLGLLFLKQLHDKDYSIKLYYPIITVLITGSLYFLNPVENSVYENRFSLQNEIAKSSQNLETSSNLRMESIEESVEILMEKPLTGAGLGGFNAETKHRMREKYPHNMILEYAAEMGFPGLVAVIGLIFVILRAAYKEGLYVFLFFALQLMASMTSKDIPSQTFFFSGLFLLFLSKDDIQKIKAVLNSFEINFFNLRKNGLNTSE